ncbi:Bgt-20256 [Blumeria graminis f. sp. tritici]|uniref:Bgt-20256 n=1 Tax=Blumeria graminis f. sp. tritici TaxID=62690 RepID=A0A9X9PQE4_BLUGR|nr:Bgt-20256 [Blumeria graminis f. sp. tritici]
MTWQWTRRRHEALLRPLRALSKLKSVNHLIYSAKTRTLPECLLEHVEQIIFICCHKLLKLVRYL